jgi:hypothetical protein
MGQLDRMKTTLEIPDAIFREAKSAAAKQGIPLREFVTRAVSEKLRASPAQTEEKPWMKFFGGLKEYHEENMRIDKIIEEEFEQIEPEDWQ